MDAYSGKTKTKIFSNCIPSKEKDLLRKSTSALIFAKPKYNARFNEQKLPRDNFESYRFACF